MAILKPGADVCCGLPASLVRRAQKSFCLGGREAFWKAFKLKPKYVLEKRSQTQV